MMEKANACRYDYKCIFAIQIMYNITLYFIFRYHVKINDQSFDVLCVTL